MSNDLQFASRRSRGHEAQIPFQRFSISAFQLLNSFRVFLSLVSALSLQPSASLQAGTTIDPFNRYAYGANLGWMNAVADTNNGAVIGEYVCSGYIYSANVGWINLGSGAPANEIQYQNNSAADFGVNNDGFGNLTRLCLGREHRLDHLRANFRPAEGEHAHRADERLRLERQLRLDFLEQCRRLCADRYDVSRSRWRPTACPSPGC